MSGNIIIATSKIKACGLFYDLCRRCGYEDEWTDALWGALVTDEELYDELAYFLSSNTLKDSVQIRGYSLSDLYVFQMNRYNLIREIGKNPVECNKERMVLGAFRMMADMKADPETIVRRIEEGRGEDKL